MKLYYAPGACSLSPHIVLNETGLKYKLEKVDLARHRTDRDVDFYAVNAKGYVPALELDDGKILTEGPAIVQYLADLVPASKLAPPAGTFEHYQLLEWLNFITAELHKQFGPFFHGASEDEKQKQRALLEKRFSYLEEHLKKNSYLVGNAFSVGDAYLFVILTWVGKTGIDLGAWPALQSYFTRIGERDAVRRALAEEGLSPK